VDHDVALGFEAVGGTRSTYTSNAAVEGVVLDSGFQGRAWVGARLRAGRR
jgi:hypothetical protein